MGLRDPERRVYQVGFALTGLLLAQSVRIWRATIWPLLRSAGEGLSISIVAHTSRRCQEVVTVYDF